MLKVSAIKESGTNNILNWALSNGAIIKGDYPLINVINDELFYIVTLSDVNFFEMFRLTQTYRNKLRIVNEYQADIPPRTDLIQIFPGGIKTGDNDETVPTYEVVEHVLNTFINIALQMKGDDDIIRSSAVRMFFPMITRKFDVQIPISFYDLVESMDDDASSKIFNSNYPATLQNIVEDSNHMFNIKLRLGFVTNTSVIKYNKRYEQYLQITKYFALANNTSNKLYKVSLIGFHAFNNLSRGEERCSLFKSDDQKILSTFKTLASMGRDKIMNNLKVDFAVQLPIQYMQMLENSFGNDVLEINYEASMSMIVNRGITFNDFMTPEFNTEDLESGESEEVKKYNNSVEAYRVRIEEATQILLNSIGIILNSNDDVGTTSTFSMLPSIYNTVAVISINMANISDYNNHYDPLIAEMLNEMIDISNGLVNDICKSKK